MSLSLEASEASMAQGELRVLLLGPLRRLLELDAFDLAFPAKGSQALFWQLVVERFPKLRGGVGTIRLARNSGFLAAEDGLCAGDEIALIPPVSGG